MTLHEDKEGNTKQHIYIVWFHLYEVLKQVILMIMTEIRHLLYPEVEVGEVWGVIEKGYRVGYTMSFKIKELNIKDVGILLCIYFNE